MWVTAYRASWIRERPRLRDERRLNLVVLFGATLLALCAGAAIAATASLDDFWFFLGLVALSTATIGVLALLAKLSRDALSPLGLTAVFYLLGYAAGGLYFWANPLPSTPLIDELPFPPTHHDLTSAIWIATFAWIAFVVGYQVNPLRSFVRAVPRLPSARGERPVSLIVAPLLVGGWIARIELIATGRYFHQALGETIATPSSYVTFVMSNAPVVATAFVGAYHYLNRDRLESNRWRNAFWALAIIELLWTIPSGTRGQTLEAILMLLVVGYYGTSRAIRLGVVATATVLIVFIVFPFALYYRNSSTDYRLAPETALSDAARITLGRLPTHAPADGLGATFSRFSDVASLAEIVRKPPSYSGRAPGETLAWTAESLVPRAILRSKEDPGLFGHEFGSTYGLLSARNVNTSVAVTQPGELYMNFGVLGMLLMIAVGAVYRAIGDYLAARGDDPAALAIYAGLAWPILSSQETILASGLTGVLKILVAFTVVMGVLITLASRRRTFSARGHVPQGPDSPGVRALPGRATSPR
jgi:hypothetical protein